MHARIHPTGKPSWRNGVRLGLFALMFFGVLAGEGPARAGGPLLVGGPSAVEGVPFTWDTTTEIGYRTDRGRLGSMDNATANARVEAMFQVWEQVSTARIGVTRVGRLPVNVDTVAELNALSCAANPIVYDQDSTLFAALGFGPSVVGFAGPCSVGPVGGANRILGGWAALNGRFQDGNLANGELTPREFDAVFIHEFGPLFGLDHSQINFNCLFLCDADDLEGLPTMFPVLLGPAQKTLAPDDIAWVSRLYPAASFRTSFGTISGTVLFSDGTTPAQGVNVVARRVDDPGTPEDESRRIVVSTASGYLFTGNPGQAVTGTNPGASLLAGGSRDPLFIGTFDLSVPSGNYTVEVESISAFFVGGSSVGPLDPPLPAPGPNEFWDLGESSTDLTTDSSPVTVSPGAGVSGIDIILNGTGPRFDQFESNARLGLRERVPPWVRKEIPGSLPVAR